MPLVDMPLGQLKTFEGRNPRPADMDSFWDKSIAEMHALGTDCELIPNPIKAKNAECFDLFFQGMGGARVHAKFARPKTASGPHPAVVMFHGYSGHAGEWLDKLAYVNQGYTVAALDCRGQAGQSEDSGQVTGNTLRGHIIRGLDDAVAGRPEKLLFRNMFLDTAQLARIVMAMPDVDEKRVGATGGSQGGGLTLACAALEPGIVRAAPVYPFLCDYKRVWEMDLAINAYEELKTYFRNFDPLHQREDEIFTALGYIDNQHLAHRIRAEVLMPVGQVDTVCPPSTQFAAYNKITSKKTILLYQDFGHEGLPDVSTYIFDFMADL